MAVYRNMTEEGYAGLYGVRASWLKVLYTQTPAHLKARMMQPLDSDALRVGRALHTAVLEPQEYGARFMRVPKVDRRTKEGKAQYEQLLRDAGARAILNDDEADMVDAMTASVRSTSAERVLAMADMREVVLTGEIAGMQCKARVDACSAGGLLVDIKTTLSAAPRAFTRSIVDFGYLLQLSLYRELMRQNGMAEGATVLIAVEKQAPYATALYALTEADIERMGALLPSLVARFSECLDAEEWPAYPQEVQPLAMPEWAFRNEEVNQ